MVLRVPFWLVVFRIGSSLTGQVSVAGVEPTSGLVDGFRDEPQTGKFACLCLIATPTTGSPCVGSCVGQFRLLDFYVRVIKKSTSTGTNCS